MDRAAMDISLEEGKTRWMDFKSKGKLNHLLKEIVSETFMEFFPKMTVVHFRTKILLKQSPG